MKYADLVAKSLIIVCVLTFNGCKKQGPMEKAGSRVDEVVDNAKEGEPLLKKKGPAEKLGESLDGTK